MARSFLLNADVLLDYADPDRAGHQTAFDLVNCALGQNVKLLITPCSLKDIYHTVIASEKRRIRAAGEASGAAAGTAAASGKDLAATSTAAAGTASCTTPPPKECALINDYAFSLVEGLTEIATVLSDAPNNPRMAVKLRKVHPDFEDNLLLAAAMNVSGCILITSDQQLIVHSPVGALTPTDALALLAPKP